MAMKIAIGIATMGRPTILGASLDVIFAQSRLPDRVIICPARSQDCEERWHGRDDVQIVHGQTGSSFQRNVILDAAEDFDIMVFLDDDFFVHRDFLAEVEALFEKHPDVAIATGTVLLDGVTSGGLTEQVAGRCLQVARLPPVERLTEVFNGYGCNMCVRLQPVREHGIRFDEALPLYAWLEDVDFSVSLSKYGRIVKSNRLQGVHLGSKAGRTPGLKFGYSQIANPFYLVRKGVLTRKQAMSGIWRVVMMNALRSVAQEAWVDRRGRLKGNMAALHDIMRGRSSPDRILLF